MSITAEGNIVILQSVSNDKKESYVEYRVKKCYCAQCKDKEKTEIKDKEKTYLYLLVKFSFKIKQE
jgi:hypothetical protein